MPFHLRTCVMYGCRRSKRPSKPTIRTAVPLPLQWVWRRGLSCAPMLAKDAKAFEEESEAPEFVGM